MAQVSPHAMQRLPVWWGLVVLFCVAELVRVGAAIGLVHRNRQLGVVHEFPDSELYWKLALNIAAGEPYNDGRRQILRTPGYPAFLAASIRLFGESPVAARHAQAAVGAISCVLLFLLVRRLIDAATAWIAAWLAALYPLAIFLSVVLLSESVFTFVLLLQLLCVSKLYESLRATHGAYRAMWAALTGITGALATLVRPSWLAVMPLLSVLLPALVPHVTTGRTGSGDHRRSRWLTALPSSVIVLVACVAVLCPWWVRNWKLTGHFVPTTLWVGASLYDGWNPRATGASNMEFMDQPANFGLDPALGSMSEWEQDGVLRREAWRFARSHPAKVAQLAVIKFIRFWNPLPNASEWRSWPVRLVSLVTVGPLLALIVVGAWKCRHQWAIVLILAGPVLYFCAIHLVFVSSLRYREAAMLPAIGLAAVALSRSMSKGN